MPLTEYQLRESGRLISRDDEGTTTKGLWRIEPPLKIRALQEGLLGEEQKPVIKIGGEYEASMWDESGKYAGCIHLHPTAAFWWPMDMFEIIN